MGQKHHLERHAGRFAGTCAGPAGFPGGRCACVEKRDKMPAELWRLTASELALHLRNGDCSALETIDAHIARIDAVNPELNALVYERFEQARAEARAADERRAAGRPIGRLHGVPITVKESLDVAGMPSTYGLRSRLQTIAERDDPHVARLRAAGAIVLGKTNVSQLLLYLESDNPVYGRTNNPWDPARTPGGSSGGEAAIVAAGGSPLGIGTDLGGSVRVPATFCGLAGMKPTAGRTADRFGTPAFAGQTAIESQIGVLARDVRDVAFALGCLNAGSRSSRPLDDPYRIDVSSLRIGYYLRAGWLPSSAAAARAVIAAVGILEGLGAHVVRFAPPDPDGAEDLFYGILGADRGRSIVAALGRNRCDPRIAEIVGVGTKPRAAIDALRAILSFTGQRGLAKIVNNYGYGDTAHYWKLVTQQTRYRRGFAAALDQAEDGPLDILIGPAFATPAFGHGESRRLANGGAYDVTYNVLGYPAGVVPVTRVRVEEESDRRRTPDRIERAARRADAEIGRASCRERV